MSRFEQDWQKLENNYGNKQLLAVVCWHNGSNKLKLIFRNKAKKSRNGKQRHIQEDISDAVDEDAEGVEVPARYWCSAETNTRWVSWMIEGSTYWCDTTMRCRADDRHGP